MEDFLKSIFSPFRLLQNFHFSRAHLASENWGKFSLLLYNIFAAHSLVIVHGLWIPGLKFNLIELLGIKRCKKCWNRFLRVKWINSALKSTWKGLCLFLSRQFASNSTHNAKSHFLLTSTLVPKIWFFTWFDFETLKDPSSKMIET